MKTLPKFSVGEVVILQSRSRPEMNGEDTVIEIIEHGRVYRDRISGEDIRCLYQDAYLYKLERSIVESKTTCNKVCEVGWVESALRKKQEPGEMSFMQLMSSLNIEEKV